MLVTPDPDILLAKEQNPYIKDMNNRAVQLNKLKISRCKTDACRTIKKYRFNKFWKPAIRTHNIIECAINCASKSCSAIRKKIKNVRAQTIKYYDDHCLPMRMRKSREKCIAEKNDNFLKLIDQHTDCIKSKCAAEYKKFRTDMKNRSVINLKTRLSRCKTDACRTIKKNRFNKLWKKTIKVKK